MGEGNFQDYGMRSYNPRVGRFFTVDPLAKSYPELTPYQFASNTPIQAIDLDGEEKFHYTLIRSDKGKPTLKLSRVENFTETNTEWKPTLTNWLNNETTTVVNPRREYIVHGTVTITAGLDGDRISTEDVTWTFSSVTEMRAAEKHGGPSNYGGWSSVSSDQWLNIAGYQSAIGLLEAEAESETGGMAGLGSKLRFRPKATTSTWKGPTDYSSINDPKNVNSSTKPTPRQVREMKKLNKEHNNGVLRDDVTGEIGVDSQKSTRGVTPASNEIQVDHITSVKNGGTREIKNLQLRTRKNNRDKWHH